MNTAKKHDRHVRRKLRGQKRPLSGVKRAITWFASAAAVERTTFDGRTSQLFRSGGRWRLSCVEASPRFWNDFEVDVTARSLVHIDRIAREWISHGVAPTLKGGLGVGKTPFFPHDQKLDFHAQCEARRRFYAAELRFSRVVSTVDR